MSNINDLVLEATQVHIVPQYHEPVMSSIAGGGLGGMYGGLIGGATKGVKGGVLGTLGGAALGAGIGYGGSKVHNYLLKRHLKYNAKMSGHHATTPHSKPKHKKKKK